VPPPKTGTALDFGCGPGRLSAGLAAAGFSRVVGVDVSTTMFAKAREIVDDDRCEFVHDDGTELATVADDSIDLVYSCRVLQHMPPELALGYVRHFLRVAATRGRAARGGAADNLASSWAAFAMHAASFLASR
jgi:ubiquinone/menaquinone biosynthesis C-methylase UbiE